MTTEAQAPILKIERQPVLSSNLKAIGYDAATQTLDVEFASTRVYRYTGVPAKLHQDLLEADSIGSFYAKNIRNKFGGVDLDTLDQHEGSTAD